MYLRLNCREHFIEDVDGTFEIRIASRSRAGNWLPTGGIERYALMLKRKEADGLIFLGHRLPKEAADLVRSMQAGRAPVVNGCEFSPSLGIPSVHIDNATDGRHKTKREVVAHGIANVVSGLCGGVPVVLSRGIALASYNAGARTRMTVVVTALALAFALTFGRL